MRAFWLGLGALAAAAVLGSGIVADAQEKKEKKGPACNAIKTQATCEGRADCQWVAALMKDGKQTRVAYCRAKPSTPANKT